FNRRLAGLGIQRSGFENNIRFRKRQPLVDSRRRRCLIIPSQQLCDIDGLLTRTPTHSSRRNTCYLPFNSIILTQLVRLRNQQPRERTPNVAKSKEAESVSFHV